MPDLCRAIAKPNFWLRAICAKLFPGFSALQPQVGVQFAFVGQLPPLTIAEQLLHFGPQTRSASWNDCSPSPASIWPVAW